MDIVGLCSVCGKPGAMHSCILCGRIVCINCYDSTNRVCTHCNTGTKFR